MTEEKKPFTPPPKPPGKHIKPKFEPLDPPNPPYRPPNKQKEPQRRGTKPGKVGVKIKERIDQTFPTFTKLSPKTSIYEKAQHIAEVQITKLESLSCNGLLSVADAKIAIELVKLSMLVDAKSEDLDLDTSPELIMQAISTLEKPEAKELNESEETETSEND